MGRIGIAWSALALLAALSLLAPQTAVAQGSFVSSSETRSATSTVIVGGGGALSSQLQKALSAGNGNAVAAALTQMLGPVGFSQTTTTSATSYLTFGPATLPIGAGPGTVNCTGLPSGTTWPVPNCDFTGYQTLAVVLGAVNVNANTPVERQLGCRVACIQCQMGGVAAIQFAA